MKRAIDTGFIPVDGVLVYIRFKETYGDDHPAVLAAPGMFVDVVDAEAVPEPAPVPIAPATEEAPEVPGDEQPFVRRRERQVRRG